MLTVYILKLENDKYYIGRTTKSIYERVLEHSLGEASAWTKLNKPLEIVDFKFNADKFDTDLYVKKYMDKYGISNVRGGSYTSIRLPTEKYNLLREELATANMTQIKKKIYTPKTVRDNIPKSKQYNSSNNRENSPEQQCNIM